MSSNPVSADIERLLGTKSLQELEGLEKQILSKLQSNEPIDVEYWEQLLNNVAVYKSRAELSSVYEKIIQNRLDILKGEQRAEAFKLGDKLAAVTTGIQVPNSRHSKGIDHTRQLDPDPLLKIRPEDKSLEVLDEQKFLDQNVSEKEFGRLNV